jgi:hypothetical protein
VLCCLNLGTELLHIGMGEAMLPLGAFDEILEIVASLSAGWTLAGGCDKLHVTSRGGLNCEHEPRPSRLGIRSERIASGCANRACGRSRSGYPTCGRLLL